MGCLGGGCLLMVAALTGEWGLLLYLTCGSFVILTDTRSRTLRVNYVKSLIVGIWESVGRLSAANMAVEFQ